LIVVLNPVRRRARDARAGAAAARHLSTSQVLEVDCDRFLERAEPSPSVLAAQVFAGAAPVSTRLPALTQPKMPSGITYTFR
jgi:hypothetical protein